MQLQALSLIQIACMAAGSLDSCACLRIISVEKDFQEICEWVCINHRITGWNRPLNSSPTVPPTPPRLLNHIPKCHIYTFIEHLQGRWLSHLPGQPIPMSDHSFSKEIFPNIQSKSPLTQPEASLPIASYLGAATNTCLTTTSFQVVVETISETITETISETIINHWDYYSCLDFFIHLTQLLLLKKLASSCLAVRQNTISLH